MEFRVLGPLEVRAGGRLLDLGGLRQQRILAALLLNANRMVDLSQLVEAGWDDDPPATARRQAQNRVAALRAVLTRAGGFIDTQESGYLLRVGPGELDALVFDDLVAQGLAAGDAGPLREALALWRGPALAGLGSAALAGDAAALDDKRLAAFEELVDLESAAGRHAELIDELAAEVAAHPLRERLVGRLMTALHRVGRSDDAEATYRTLADRLADELGIDPSPELRRLHAEISDSNRPEPTALAIPQQLPADVAGFTGRVGDLARLDGVLSDGQQQRTVVISAIAGTAGVGKTALAVHWAHRVRDKFPDGQLYVNLRGHAQAPPVRPIDALGRFLRALGVPAEQVPTDAVEAAALYQDTLSGKRLFVLLDNAASAEQLRPLLPASSGSFALVTSRDALGGLAEGVGRLALGVLAPDEAVALLGRILGEDRVAAEPAAVAELARLCAYLPLALRIAAANVAGGEGLAEYTARLAAGNRLAALAVDGDQEAAVRAAFDLSYTALPDDVRRLFRLLGLAPGVDVTAGAAAALADITEDEAARLLDKLTDAHLVERHIADRRAPARYALHDLLRLYAAELAGAEPEPAAVGRVYDFHVRAARSAVDVVYPGLLHLPLPERTGEHWSVPAFTDHAEALAWLDAERANLVLAATSAAGHGQPAAAWLLADTLRGYFFIREERVDLIEVARAGLAAADAAGEPRAQAIVHLTFANLTIGLSRYQEGLEHFQATLRVALALDWPEAQCSARGGLGAVYRMLGRPRLAEEHLTQALALTRALAWTAGETINVSTLGLVHWELGQLARALECQKQALELYRQLGVRGGEAITLDNLGEVYHDLGRLDEARRYATEALALYREIGEIDGHADASRLLAAIERNAGRRDLAFELATATLDTIPLPVAQRVHARLLNVLAGLHEDAGRLDDAAEHCLRALGIARDSGNRYPEVEALIGLAGIYGRAGRPDEALARAGEALDAAVSSEYRMLEGRARAALAEIRLAGGEREQAMAEAERALAIQRETGHRPGEEWAAEVLARIRP